MTRTCLNLYAAAAWAAQPLLRRKLARRGVAEPGYLHAVEERFGRYTTPRPPMPAGGGALVWVHAVSLGETRAAALLVEALRARLPGMRLLLTHGTATGRAEGEKLLRAGDVQVWQPWDTRGAVRRFLRHFRPSVGVLMETEIWPNLVHECAAHGVPLALANARLSEKSLRSAQRAGWLMRPAYAALAAVWAQTEADAARLRALGAPVAGVLGNLKFDARPDAALLARGQAWRAGLARLTSGPAARPVILLASSREGEEQALAEQILALGQNSSAQAAMKNEADAARAEHGARAALAAPARLAPSMESSAEPSTEQWPTQSLVQSPLQSPVQWLVVPRHPQRFDAVAALLAARGLRVSRRSQWGGPGAEQGAEPGDGPPQAAGGLPPAAGAADVWLGDSLGEMPAYYALADVALLGASFAPLGGQNLIEAAACGCPVVMGPHTFNFAQAADMAQAAGAARRVADMAEGVAVARALAADAHARAAMSQAARDFASAHRGAAARTAQAVLALLPGAGAAEGAAAGAPPF
ncbi:3-deoxy-D-manno-octulosonic acid transferase [Comamonadaceae bacterium OH2545_COT-014]|nr:3-deoxy-D-manno-octulosonic acid transferase [Comamonadaceae bacterium OH2545_COT-014]